MTVAHEEVLTFHEDILEIGGGYFGVAGIEGEHAWLYLGPAYPVFMLPCSAPVALAVIGISGTFLVLALVIAMGVRISRRAAQNPESRGTQ
jgi:hypothetical protein